MSTPGPRSTGDRIPYLDGLRGYSILTVVVLHAFEFSHGPMWLGLTNMLFGNGTLGVDIFFVISGFLITTLLLKESDRAGAISLPDFYKRRIARIFPASYTYIAVIALLNLAGILHIWWRGFIPPSLFCWNYSTLLNIPPAPSTRYTFNHFWSLALEEQFYLVWPACLAFMSRKNAKRMAWIVVAAMPFVRIASYALFPKSRPQLNWMFHTSADMILWGALVAFAYSEEVHLRLAKKRWFGWATLAYGIAAVFGMGLAGNLVPGHGRFIDPTLNTSFAALLLLWLLSGSNGILRAILEWKPLRWVGIISYSLYIWQQVFLIPESPLRMRFPFNILIAVMAASISYYFVEAPLRKRLREVLIRRSARNRKTALQET